MKYTLQQAREAIRQNPIAAREMRLTTREMQAYVNCKEFTSEAMSEALGCDNLEANRLLRSLCNKGYLVKLDSRAAVYGRVVYAGDYFGLVE